MSARRTTSNQVHHNKDAKHEQDETPLGRPDNAVYQKLRKTMEASKDKGLGTLVSELMDLAIIELSNKEGRLARDGVKLFVEGGLKEPKECIIDDCIRWNILLKNVNLDAGRSDVPEARIDLSQMLVEHKPYLAFENPYKSTAQMKELYEKQCTNHKGHKSHKDQSTPFRVAAACGNHAVIAAMISNGRQFYENHTRAQFYNNGNPLPFPSILLQGEPGRQNSEGILMLAMGAAQNHLETLERLLEVDDIVSFEGTGKGDDAFQEAIDEGKLDVVNKFLGRPRLAKIFATSTYILQALQTLARDDANKTSRLGIVKRLVSLVQNPNEFNHDVVKGIITTGRTEIWDSKLECILPQSMKSRLLHLAVWHQEHDFVKLFLTKHPESLKQEQAVTEGGKEHYPLWYNNHREGAFERHGSNSKEIKEGIRNDIVNKMIHEASDIEALTDVLYSSDETVGEVCFDISSFNSASYRVSEFVYSLIKQMQKQTLLSYEQTLLYAEFPSLDMPVEERETFIESSHFQREHIEVFEILKWLRNRGVETIINLKIPDRLINPHDDEKMATFVDRFKVEVLDWKVLDLSISVLAEGTKERIKELHLYSSGNRAVISHWFSENGIPSLKNLTKLEIKVVQETCTSKRCGKLKAEIRKTCKIAVDRKCTNARWHVESVPWFPTPKLANLSQIAHRVAPKLARWLPELRSKIAERKRETGGFKPTKVAILDNGILSISPASPPSEKEGAHEDDQEKPVQAGGDGHDDTTKGPDNGDSGISLDAGDVAFQDDDRNSLWKRIKEGRSFVDGRSRLSPWSFASNPHGTQMANLICAIDPFCELYVARVAEDAVGITSKRVAQAIDWAIKKGVDVISMSFTIGRDEGDLLSAAIRRATESDIVMTCSVHDEGSRIVRAWPAACHAVDRPLIRLAACDKYGKILREADEETYDYLIEGQDVAAGVIPFLKSEDTITGSSVSTAIAAGLSSLILTCRRLRTNNATLADRYLLVIDQLNKMRAPNSKFVLLDNFAHFNDLVGN